MFSDFAPVSSNQISTQMQKFEQYIKKDPEANEPMGNPEMDATDIAAKLRLLGSLRISREGRLEKQEKAVDSPIRYVTPNCTPRFVASSSSNKILPLPSASPWGTQKRKSAVIRLSLKRKSFDGDQTTEICMIFLKISFFYFNTRFVVITSNFELCYNFF